MAEMGLHGEIKSATNEAGKKFIGIKVFCGECANEFFKGVSQIKSKPSSQHYCSVVCRQKAQKKSVTGSKSKRWKGGPVERKCAICGKTFLRKRDQIATRMSVFCSTRCFGLWKSRHWRKDKHPSWSGGYKYKHGAEAYHGGWSKIREEVKNRDGNRCVFCGHSQGQLHVHHKIPLRMFETPDKANRKENLITLCVPCHKKEEKTLKKKYKKEIKICDSKHKN